MGLEEGLGAVQPMADNLLFSIHLYSSEVLHAFVI